jgi:hypothetical protein
MDSFLLIPLDAFHPPHNLSIYRYKPDPHSLMNLPPYRTEATCSAEQAMPLPSPAASMEAQAVVAHMQLYG